MLDTSTAIDSPLEDAAADLTAAAPLTVEQAIAHLIDPDVSLRYYAAWWLGKFLPTPGACTPEQLQVAVDRLIEALTDEADRTELGGYPLRRNAARALGKLGDRRAVPDLIACLDCSDFYVRESASQSLAMLGDRMAIPALRRLLAGGVAEAQLVPGRPHLNQPYEAVLEALGDLGAVEAIAEIAPFLEHGVARVQYAAARSMYRLTREPQYGEQLVMALQGADLQLRRAALSDLGAIGYLPAADAIARAPAENSFKLFSLKGLLEYELKHSQPTVASTAHAIDDFSAQLTLSETARHLLHLMDQLL